jgi:malate/lactate dehydrogenase
MPFHDRRKAIPQDIAGLNEGIDQHGVTLSLPSVVGRAGVTAILPPQLSDEERPALQRTAETAASKAAYLAAKTRRY